MKANTKKMLSAACVLTLTVSALAGCAKSETKTGAGAASDSQKPAEPFKVTIMANLQTTEVPSDKVEKLLEQKTNSQIDFQWVPDGSYDEKFQAAFATGSLPQIVYIKNQASFVLLRDAIKNGQFWEVGPYLKDYPNLKNLNPDVLKNTQVGGKVYSLYQERPLARQGIIFRKDWADKLGLSAPKTTDDIYNMLKKFKEADLGGAGKTIALADRNDLIYGAFKTLSSYFGTPNGWGVQDGKLVPDFMSKGYMDTMKFMKKLRDEGLINQDFPVTSKTDQTNLMFTGRSGMYVGSLADVQSMQEKTVKNVATAQYDVVNEIKGTDGKTSTWGLPGYGTVVLFPKTAVKTEKDLKNILAFMDKFYNPDVANLLKYGIEGEHYSMKDGKVLPITDDKLKEKDVKAYLSIALADTTNVTPSVFTMPVAEKADNMIKAAPKFAIADPSTSLDSKTYNEKGARLQDQIKDASYQFMMGKIDEAGFQAAIKKWQDDGGAKIIEEYNAAYKSVGGK